MADLPALLEAAATRDRALELLRGAGVQRAPDIELYRMMLALDPVAQFGRSLDGLQRRKGRETTPPTRPAGHRPMMRFLAIKNFARYQHYRDRNPPWIKLYGEILTDAPFLLLPEAAQAQLIKLWVLASQFGHPLPNNPKLLAGRIGVTGRFYLRLLIEAGFIAPTDNETASEDASSGASDDASKMPGNREQNATPSVRARARSRESRELRGERTENNKTGAEAPTADEQRVLDHFTHLHPRRRWGRKDVLLVRRRLAEGLTTADLCNAISGNAQDDWHHQRRKHELTYVLRDAGKISEFADKWLAVLEAGESKQDFWDNPELQRATAPV